MNARQTKKNLKKRIAKLQADNDLMRRIIEDDNTMRELYDRYNKPVIVTRATLPIQEFKVKRIIPVYMADVEGIIEHTIQEMGKDLFYGIKENIIYEIESEPEMTSITASILIGKK